MSRQRNCCCCRSNTINRRATETANANSMAGVATSNSMYAPKPVCRSALSAAQCVPAQRQRTRQTSGMTRELADSTFLKRLNDPASEITLWPSPGARCRRSGLALKACRCTTTARQTPTPKHLTANYEETCKWLTLLQTNEILNSPGLADRTSALGQTRKLRRAHGMSALPPTGAFSERT